MTATRADVERAVRPAGPGPPKRPGLGRRQSARGHAAGSRLAFPTTRFRAWGGQPVSPPRLRWSAAGPSASRRRPILGIGADEAGIGDVRLGVTHQALELLTGRVDVGPVDVGPVDRVRLPAPAVAVVWQPDGPAAREDGGAPRRHLVEAGRFVPIDEHRPPLLPADRARRRDASVEIGCERDRVAAAR